MELILFPKLNRKSQAAMKKTKKKYGHLYRYEPNGQLLKRLSQEMGMSLTEVREQLIKEREYLIKQSAR